MSLNSINAGRDENARWDVTGVASSLAGLGADEIDTDIEGLLHMLWVADHVHDDYAGFVELIDGPLGRNTDSRDKEGGFLFDDDFEELRELTIGVVSLS
jgi:hypothetical protein